MRLALSTAVLATVASLAPFASAAVTATLTPLASFAGGDGYRAVGEVVAGDNPGSTFSGSYGYLGTGNTERGLAYNPVTGNLLLVSRLNPGGNGSNNVRILNGITGADSGSLSSTNISGGTFGVNTIGVASDGAIYLSNLQGATTSTGANYTIYRYANETATNTIAYSGAPAVGVRLGDSFDVTGSGTGTRIVAGFNATNGYTTFSTADGSAYTSNVVTVANTASGDFRYSDAFGATSSNVIGAGNSNIRNTTYSGTTGTLVNSIGLPPLQSTAEHLIDYSVVGTTPILVTQSTGDSRVRIYDATDLTNLVLLATSTALPAAAASTLPGNGNASGQITFGAIDNVNNTATIYALSTNQGIQAFTLALTPVAAPEPTTLAAIAGAGLTLVRRRRRA